VVQHRRCLVASAALLPTGLLRGSPSKAEVAAQGSPPEGDCVNCVGEVGRRLRPSLTLLIVCLVIFVALMEDWFTCLVVRIGVTFLCMITQLKARGPAGQRHAELLCVRGHFLHKHVQR